MRFMHWQRSPRNIWTNFVKRLPRTAIPTEPSTRQILVNSRRWIAFWERLEESRTPGFVSQILRSCYEQGLQVWHLQFVKSASLAMSRRISNSRMEQLLRQELSLPYLHTRCSATQHSFLHPKTSMASGSVKNRKKELVLAKWPNIRWSVLTWTIWHSAMESMLGK